MRFKTHPGVTPRQTARPLFFENLENRLLLSTAPSIIAVTPAAGTTAIALNAAVTATVTQPNGGINPTTVTSSNVYLYQTAFPNNNAKFVPASVKTTGGGDALILSPLQNLLPNTSYTFVVTSGLADVTGVAFTPYTEAFTTGNTVPVPSQNFAFTKVALPTTAGYAVTDVQMGPDGELWASTEVGQILRFPINSDGTLGTPQVISSLQTAYGGNRLITGFAFDPSFVANPGAPMIWVSNTYYALSGATNAPNFTSSLTVMSGPNLATVKDAIVDLPRSVADHVNDQPVFQPGTDNLFFCQAGQNAYGAPDTTWGNRAETLLSAAILEVNTSALNLSGPALNVLTPDVGGTYNPYQTGAPLTIYATGIRNAFDLLFDDKGQLWAPANGSSSGGNTPAGGGAPALTDVQQVEEDQLFKVVKGAYYGHPDPARNQFVLDQGNPSTGAIAGLAFTAYPAGTAPDPNYHLPNYIFGLHSSPDGIIEYQGSAFDGTLAGKFLVAEYSAPDDIAVLSRDSGDNIIGGLVSTAQGIGAEHGVSGFTDLNGPVSLVEDDATGFIYVSELVGNKITLLEPSSVKQQITPSTANLAFNTIAAGNPGAAASRTETVTITNTGADQLTLSSVGIINDPNAAPAASTFTITNSGSIPTSLNSVGVSFTFQITYSASLVGLQSAILQIKSNDPVTPTLDITLNGIGTAGQYGSLEPSLVQVLRAFNIPTIVGAGPDDANINTVPYPTVPDPSSQEVDMQRMVAATPGNVTITPLASFSTATQPVSDIGYYTPGNPSATTQLFDIAMADSQTLNPTAVGSTSFNPGANPFGLYALFPGVSTPNSAPDYHYSEDSLNTPLDPNNPRKIRFFPYETSAGTVVPNTFVFAVEDYNDATVYNSFVNFVGIISNVAGAPPVPANLTVASNTSAGVTLTWTASAGATSYNVQRIAPGATTFTTVATGLTSPTYLDTDVADGATYQYEVQAVNAVDSSAFSAAVQVTRSVNPPPPSLPDPPSGLAVSSQTASGVGLSWTAGAGATSYVVERSSTGASGFAEIATGITATSYVDSNVIMGQTYQYEVFSQNSNGLSAGPSGVVSATIASAPESLSVVVGKGANKSVQFFNDAGTLTTIKLAGFGTATVNFGATTISQAAGKTGVVVSGTDITLTSITTTGTLLRNSVLTITTHGGPNSVSLGAITVDASLNAINAPTAALVGAFSVAGSINRISLGSVNAGAITVGGGIGMLKVPAVTGLALTAGGAIKAINSTVWTSSQPINAPSIGVITINGSAQLDLATAAVRAVHVKGVLQNSTFALSGGGLADLAMLSAGAISNTVIDAAGNLGSITAGTLDNSQILAGTGISGMTAFPPVSVFPSAATIAAVHLKTIKGAMSLVNSSIAASSIKTLSLGRVQFSNGGVKFGVEANSISSLSSVNPANGKPFTLTKLTSANVVTTELSAKGISTQDFDIDIV